MLIYSIDEVKCFLMLFIGINVRIVNKFFKDYKLDIIIKLLK